MNKTGSLHGNSEPIIADSCLMTLSPALCVMSFNQEAQRLLGGRPTPGQSYRLDEMFQGPEFSRAKAAVRSALNDGKPCCNQTGHVRHSSGKRLLCQYSTHPLFGNEHTIIGVILSLRIPPAMDPLPENPEIDYQILFEELPEGVFAIDTKWRITLFNRMAEAITGFKKHEALGRRCWEIFRSDLCRRNCPMGQTLKTGKTQLDQEVAITNRRGRRQTLLVNVSVLNNQQGRSVGGVETLRTPDHEQSTPHTPDMRSAFSGVIGKSPALQSLFAAVPEIAASNANVLISGESGTGKDMLALAIHKLSTQRYGPFVAVNCSALTESLLESELFGHEKGAFTGAERTKPGRFELAGAGTLFLDEIGELKPDLQVKLLRVIEQREFERVGGNRPIPFRARLISATNRDLTTALKQGRFREDLYYRLRTVPLMLPPLRERTEDIPLLVDHFIITFNAKYRKSVRSIDPKVLCLFKHHNWPGNIRELERCIEHAFVFVKGPVIFPRYLPDIAEFRPDMPGIPATRSLTGKNKDEKNIRWALAQTGGRRQAAAALLGISRTSMWRRMKDMGLI